MRETTAFLHGLLRDEIAAVDGGAANVVLGGLSQGCAASLIALLLWEGEALGAAVGMCGWLPYAASLQRQLADGHHVPDDEDHIVFEDDDAESESDVEIFESDPRNRAITWLRDELNMPSTPSSSGKLAFRDTPLLLAHGLQDDRVGIALGRSALRCLRDLGSEAAWREYEALGHWYSDKMLQDMTKFLRATTKWLS